MEYETLLPLTPMEISGIITAMQTKPSMLRPFVLGNS